MSTWREAAVAYKGAMADCEVKSPESARIVVYDSCPLFKVPVETGTHAYFSHAQYCASTLAPRRTKRRPGRPLVRCKNNSCTASVLRVSQSTDRGAWSLSKLPHPSVHHPLPFALFYSPKLHRRLPVFCGHKISDRGVHCRESEYI